MRIWAAISDRIVALIKPKAAEVLTPDICQCGHLRCCHENGKDRCRCQFAPDEKHDTWTVCACQIFIDGDDDDDDDDNAPTEPTPADLEALSLLVN